MNLYSPADGIVGKRLTDPRMSAIPNLISIDIVKIGKVFAKVPISGNEISYIKKGDRAKRKTAILNNVGFIRTVEEIRIIVDPIAHTYKTKIRIVNKNRQIKPGMICDVTIDKFNKTVGLLVPNSVVLFDEERKYFIVFRESK